MKGTVNQAKIKLSRAEMRDIIAKEKKEFPGDWALQQVHIARDILHKEADKAGMDYIDYIRYLSRRDRESQRRSKGFGKRH